MQRRFIRFTNIFAVELFAVPLTEHVEMQVMCLTVNYWALWLKITKVNTYQDCVFPTVNTVLVNQIFLVICHA